MAGRSGQSYASLSAEIEAMYQLKKQTSAEYNRKEEWRRDISRIIAQKYSDCRLVFYGSTANGFGTSGCDIDLTLFLPSFGYGGPRLHDIASCFQRSRFQIEVVSAARVPILKLKDTSRSSYESDISVNNTNGISNTFLMSCYAHADPRVTPLIVVVKLWAEKADIKGARSHRLPGFALYLLVLHFLQAGCDPPVVPALQRRFPTIIPSKDVIIEHLEGRTVPSCVRDLRSENTQSLGELLVKFFQYYCSFDWGRTISIRNGGTQSTPFGGTWRNPHIRIEDPDDSGNVTRGVYDRYQFARIKAAFTSANDKLKRGLSLDSIF